MAQLMRAGLGPPVARMGGIQEDACADRVVKGIETGNARIDAADEHARAKLQFKQGHDVVDRRQAESQQLPKFPRILFRLEQDIARKQRPFGWIEPHALDAQKIFQLKLGLHEAVEQVDRRVDFVAMLARLPKARPQVDLRAVLPEQHVQRSSIECRKLLQFVDACAALPLFDRDKGGPRNIERCRRRRLGHLRILPRVAQQLANAFGGKGAGDHCHGDTIAIRATNEILAHARKEREPFRSVPFEKIEQLTFGKCSLDSEALRSLMGDAFAPPDGAGQSGPARQDDRECRIPAMAYSSNALLIWANPLTAPPRMSLAPRFSHIYSSGASTIPAVCMLIRHRMQAAQMPHCRRRPSKLTRRESCQHERVSCQVGAASSACARRDCLTLGVPDARIFVGRDRLFHGREQLFSIRWVKAGWTR